MEDFSLRKPPISRAGTAGRGCSRRSSVEDDGNCFFVKNVAGLDRRLVAEQKMERLLGRKSLGVVERLE